MTLQEVEAFLALAEELHFRRTADRLLLSHSRVSRLITALETEIGGKLFERTSRQVRLTPIGARLRDRLGAGLQLLQLGLDEAKASARGVVGSPRIGFTSTTDPQVFRELLHTFETRFPACEVHAREVQVADRYQSLRNDDIDVLVSWLAVDEPDLTVGPAISHQPRVLAVANDHPIARRGSVSIEDFPGLPMIDVGIGVPRALADVLVPPSTPSGRRIDRIVPLDRLTTVADVLALVEQGKIVHPTMEVVEKLFPRQGLTYVAVHDMPPIPLGLIWMTAHENARIRALAHTAQQATGTAQ